VVVNSIPAVVYSKRAGGTGEKASNKCLEEFYHRSVGVNTTWVQSGTEGLRLGAVKKVQGVKKADREGKLYKV